MTNVFTMGPPFENGVNIANVALLACSRALLRLCC